MKKLPEENLWDGLKSRLGDYREDPDEETWEKISGALPKVSRSPGLTRNKMIASLLLLLVASLGWVLYDYKDAITKEAKGSEASKNSPKVIDLSGTNMRQNSSAYNESDTAKDEVDDAAGVGMSDGSPTKDRARHRSQNIDTNPQSFSAAGSAKPWENTHDRSRDEVVKNRVQEKNNQELLESGAGDSGVDTSHRNKEHKNSALPNQNNELTTGRIAINSHNKDKTGTPGINQTGVISGDSNGSSAENLGIVNEENNATDASSFSGNTSLWRDDNSGSRNEKRKPNFVQASTLADSARGIQELFTDTTEVNGEARETRSNKAGTKKRQAINGTFYFAITPSLAFAIIEPKPGDAVNVVGLRSPGIFNEDRLGLSVDAGIERSLSDRMEWYAGLSFYRQNQRIAYEYEGPGIIVEGDGTGGYSLSPATTVKEFNYKTFNAGVSTGVFFKIMGVKILHEAGIGFQLQQGMSKANPEMAYDNSSSQYLNYQLSYRIRFPMEGKYSLYFQPTFIHSILTNEKLSQPFSVKPYRAGITLGILFTNLRRNNR